VDAQCRRHAGRGALPPAASWSRACSGAGRETSAAGRAPPPGSPGSPAPAARAAASRAPSPSPGSYASPAARSVCSPSSCPPAAAEARHFGLSPRRAQRPGDPPPCVRRGAARSAAHSRDAAPPPSWVGCAAPAWPAAAGGAPPAPPRGGAARLAARAPARPRGATRLAAAAAAVAAVAQALGGLRPPWQRPAATGGRGWCPLPPWPRVPA
jgi:hypothetical protein